MVKASVMWYDEDTESDARRSGDTDAFETCPSWWRRAHASDMFRPKCVLCYSHILFLSVQQTAKAACVCACAVWCFVQLRREYWIAARCIGSVGAQQQPTLFLTLTVIVFCSGTRVAGGQPTRQRGFSVCFITFTVPVTGWDGVSDC